MSRSAAGLLAGVSILALCASSTVLAAEAASGQAMTAAQIIARNVAARGGLEAWHKIKTMICTGHIESVHAAVPQMPFVFEIERPNKTRFEVEAQTQVSVRVYDGTHGWTLRSERSGITALQPFNAEELIFAGEGPGIGGLLMDYRAKGVMVTLDGMDDVEGRQAYRLRMAFASGNRYHVWIDAETFLDIKYDRESHDGLGQSGLMSVRYRNFKALDGVQIPLLIDSATVGAGSADRMVIDTITLNAPLEDTAFAKPGLGRE